MDDTVLRFSDAKTMPWLGGGGITHELARHPAGGDFGWRLSVAEVGQDGPFSSLPGVDRVIVLCSTGRMVLRTPDVVELQRFSPYAFDGGLRIACSVPEGPTRDFNVMTRRGVYDAQVSTVTGRAEGVESSSSATTFVVCLDGTVRVGETGLSAFDLVLVDDPTTVDAAQGVAAVVTITVV